MAKRGTTRTPKAKRKAKRAAKKKAPASAKKRVRRAPDRPANAGERGPVREDTARIKARGGWRARARDKCERESATQHPVIRRKPFRLTNKQIEHYCRTLIPGYDPWATAPAGWYFDAKAARAAVRFFPEQLCHVKGAKGGHGFDLEPWEVAIVGNLFGWLRDDGTRRYRRSLLYVPRKNGKTPIAAGVILYALFEDGEPGAEIYGAAAKYEQAALVFQHASRMCKRNDALAARCHVYGDRRAGGPGKSIQLVDHPANVDDLTAYQVVARDSSGGMDGWNMHVGVIDELHAQPDRELVDAMETAMSARRNPLLFAITTADFERESICNETYDYACAVRDRKIEDPAFLPAIWAADEKDDWQDEAVWWRVNPNLEVSKSLEYMQAQCRKAKESAGARNAFLRRDLNIRTRQSVLWLDADEWKACRGDVDAEALAGQTCYAGLDLASTSDLTAFVLGFPIDGRFKLLPFFWCPEAAIDRRREQETRMYRQWIDKGLIRTTPGNVTDYDVVRRDINELGQRYGVRGIAADRNFQGMQLAVQLGGDGFDVVAWGQGFVSMAAPTLAFETAIKGGTLEHGANPVLDWMAGNVAVEIDAAGNMKPSKAKGASKGKIDGVVCAIMALGLAEQSAGPVGYGRDELLVIG